MNGGPANNSRNCPTWGHPSNSSSVAGAMGGLCERILGLTPVNDDRFVAGPVHDGGGDAYGGEILARSLWAMTSTVAAGRVPHSVHAYYLRPAQNGETTTFAVARERDGCSFSTCQVTALQRGKNMFSAAAGFHRALAVDAAPQFQVDAIPEVPAPDAARASPMGHLLLDVRTVDPGRARGPDPDPARSTDPLPDDPVVHLCLLAYFSDLSNACSGRRSAATMSSRLITSCGFTGRSA